MFTNLDDVDPNYEYVAFDPGETTGWATFDSEGAVVQIGQFVMSEQNRALKILIKPGLKKCIIEDYKNFAWMQQKKWSRNQTSKNIGKMEMVCDIHEVEYVLQPSTNKGMGFMYLGMEEPKNHAIGHQFCAMAHGVFYLQSNGIRPVGMAMREEDK